MIWPFQKKPQEDLDESAKLLEKAREQARQEREALSKLLTQTLTRTEEHG